MITGKDLTKEAPRSPRLRLGGFAIVARTLDKCRAEIAGHIGEYHYDCPLDNMIFGFKGVKGADFKKEVEAGKSDHDMVVWLESHGEKKTAEEIKVHSDKLEAYKPFDDPEKKEWFVGVCKEVGIDPAKSTLFDFLEADDKASFRK